MYEEPWPISSGMYGIKDVAKAAWARIRLRVPRNTAAYLHAAGGAAGAADSIAEVSDVFSPRNWAPEAVWCYVKDFPVIVNGCSYQSLHAKVQAESHRNWKISGQWTMDISGR